MAHKTYEDVIAMRISRETKKLLNVRSKKEGYRSVGAYARNLLERGVMDGLGHHRV